MEERWVHTTHSLTCMSTELWTVAKAQATKSAVALGSHGVAQRHNFKDSMRCFAVPSYRISDLDAP